MLTTLRIRNLALVADLTLDLEAGCNAITGETGAGKSILIGGLNLVLGERADRTLIRSGADSCSVEAAFDVSRVSPALPRLLEEHGVEPCEDGQLLLKRSFSAAGTNRQFVNGSPVTLPVLAAIGEWLVDIHGPHEHQSLLHPSRQLAILDAFGGLEPARTAFASLLERFNALERQKRELIVDERTYAQQLDLLRFQTGEIAAAGFKPDEEEKLEEEHRRASNAARILELGQAAQETLSEGESSVLSQARAFGRALHELEKLDAGFSSMVETFGQGLEILKDVQDQLSRHLEKVDVDPARLASLEERVNLLGSLKRKYGATIDEILGFGTNAAEKLRSLEQRDAELARINSELGDLRKELWSLAKALSDKRGKVVPKLRREVCKQLEDLGFAQSRFDAPLTTLQQSATEDPKFVFNSSGIDSAEFLFAPNPGEAARPLRAIASSGELARVMLALKTVLARQDEVPVLIFDEVDANVGGQTARAIGDKMRQISRDRQVICITHSAHVAAPASAHFLVSKHVRDGRTVSEVVRLKEPQRVTELARMLGGPVEAARRHAEALLK
jgi:DNA repair protein RecN (Recombination protein N)